MKFPTSHLLHLVFHGSEKGGDRDKLQWKDLWHSQAVYRQGNSLKFLFDPSFYNQRPVIP